MNLIPSYVQNVKAFFINKKFFPFAVILTVFLGFLEADCQEDLHIWKEFVELMKNGRITVDQIRPHQWISEEGLMDHLNDLKTWTDQASSWKEWEATPEIFPVGNQVHFLIPLGFGNETERSFCFTFLKEDAVVILQTHFFYLYKRAGHLKQQIPFEDYRQIFETIWQDRAANAGWHLDITYEDPEGLKCVFHFTKKS